MLGLSGNDGWRFVVRPRGQYAIPASELLSELKAEPTERISKQMASIECCGGRKATSRVPGPAALGDGQLLRSVETLHQLIVAFDVRVFGHGEPVAVSMQHHGLGQARLDGCSGGRIGPADA